MEILLMYKANLQWMRGVLGGCCTGCFVCFGLNLALPVNGMTPSFLEAKAPAVESDKTHSAPVAHSLAFLVAREFEQNEAQRKRDARP